MLDTPDAYNNTKYHKYIIFYTNNNNIKKNNK